MRMISDGDVVSISAPAYAKFIFNEVGYQGEMNSSCSLAENIIYGSLVALFNKGNPLLNQFNKHTRQCVEGRLELKYWAQLKHETFREQKKI